MIDTAKSESTERHKVFAARSRGQPDNRLFAFEGVGVVGGVGRVVAG